jgi:hypothetical protein
VTAVRVGFRQDFDAAVLEDYFRKRVEWYERRLDAPATASQKDEFDERSHIVLATDGRQCLGGLRATVRRPDDVRPLPTERVCGGLNVFELFPDVDLPHTPHAELSKLVIVSDDGPPPFTNDVGVRLLRFLLLEANPEPDVAYALIGGGRRHARMYTHLGRLMGLRAISRPIPLALVPEDYRRVAGGDEAVLLLFPLAGTLT